MSLSHDEAAQSLRDIEATGRRSVEAMDYAYSSPGFILWGLIWMAGYAGTWLLAHWQARPGVYIEALWFVLIVIGIVGGVLQTRYRYRHLPPHLAAKGKAIGRRIGLSLFAIYAFIAATFVVMRPLNPAISGAFIPLIVATIYAIYGIWRGLRFLFVGIAVAALTLTGWFLLPYYFLLWMAAFGGGALILTGFWMRKA